MKTILGTRFLDIPDGVTVTCKARHVTVTGPRGKLEHNVARLQNVAVVKDQTRQRSRKHVRCPRPFLGANAAPRSTCHQSKTYIVGLLTAARQQSGA